jgi:hypothetical protein
MDLLVGIQSIGCEFLIRIKTAFFIERSLLASTRKNMTTPKNAAGAPVHSIVRRPQLSKIEPQPKWEETPMLSDDGYWCGRHRMCRQLSDGYGEISVEVDAIRPPNTEVAPVEQGGAWYWADHFVNVNKMVGNTPN